MTAPELILGQTGSKEAQFTMATFSYSPPFPIGTATQSRGIAVSALFGVDDWVGAVLVTSLWYYTYWWPEGGCEDRCGSGAIALGLLWLDLRWLSVMQEA